MRGFQVRAEVLSSDVVAIREDIMVAVEMKMQMGIKLLAQAAQRQKSFDLVYIAIPKPTFKRRTNKAYAELIHLVKRLELGLLYVDTNGEGVCMEEFPPKPFSREKSISSRRARKTRTDAMEEFLSRSADYNVGGSVREERVTAYRENALLIAMYMIRDGGGERQAPEGTGLRGKGISHNTRQPLRMVRARGQRHIRRYRKGQEGRKKILQCVRQFEKNHDLIYSLLKKFLKTGSLRSKITDMVTKKG